MSIESWEYPHLESAAAELMEAMSEISEDCFCAGWMTGLGFSLWGMLKTGPRRWGMEEVTQDHLEGLKLLSERAGGWVFWCPQSERPEFAPLDEWLIRFDRGQFWSAPFPRKPRD